MCRARRPRPVRRLAPQVDVDGSRPARRTRRRRSHDMTSGPGPPSNVTPPRGLVTCSGPMRRSAPRPPLEPADRQPGARRGRRRRRRPSSSSVTSPRQRVVPGAPVQRRADRGVADLLGRHSCSARTSASTWSQPVSGDGSGRVGDEDPEHEVEVAVDARRPQLVVRRVAGGHHAERRRHAAAVVRDRPRRRRHGHRRVRSADGQSQERDEQECRAQVRTVSGAWQTATATPPTSSS